jgi:mannose/fructose/N-acetylgalactosamine-specific phosphotransferase system component IID
MFGKNMIPIFKKLNQIPSEELKEELDKREKFFQVYVTLITILAALQTVPTEITYKVNSSNLSNITVLQVPHALGVLSQVALPLFIFTIIGYYIFLKINSITGYIINSCALLASLCFSYILCGLITFSLPIFYYIWFACIAGISFLSLQTKYVLENQ